MIRLIIYSHLRTQFYVSAFMAEILPQEFLVIRCNRGMEGGVMHYGLVYNK